MEVTLLKFHYGYTRCCLMSCNNVCLYLCLLVHVVYGSFSSYQVQNGQPIYRSEIQVKYSHDRTADIQGKFGVSSKIGPVSGWAIHIGYNGSNIYGCDKIDPSTARKRQWIAVIKRGECEFDTKISNAVQVNASAVVIYNNNFSGKYPEKVGCTNDCASHKEKRQLHVQSPSFSMVLSAAPGRAPSVSVAESYVEQSLTNIPPQQ